MNKFVFLCAFGVGAEVIRRENLDESEAILGPRWTGIVASVAKGVCGNREKVPVNIRDAAESTYTGMTDPTGMIRYNQARQGWTEVDGVVAETLRAKDLSRLIERYEDKAESLISHIRAVEGKTDKKGMSRGNMGKIGLGIKELFGGRTDASTAHLQSKHVQQVISRMRGFEKCRGMTRDLEHLDETTTVQWRGQIRGVQELAAQYKKLLTEGDDCCSDDCDITTMELNHETDTRTCEPCKASCQKGEDGLPSMLYKTGYYEDGNIDGPLKENYMDGADVRPTIAFTGVGRACETMTSELQEDKSPDLSFCYNDAKQCPDGVCRGIKSLARYAARALQTTIAYDTCPPSQSRDDNPETKRKDPAYQICGPFLPNYKGCSLNLEHILMRGNADEVWDADYMMEKAFGGPACLKDNGVEWFPRWLAFFTETKKQADRLKKAKEVVGNFAPYAYAYAPYGGLLNPPNDNSDTWHNSDGS